MSLLVTMSTCLKYTVSPSTSPLLPSSPLPSPPLLFPPLSFPPLLSPPLSSPPLPFPPSNSVCRNNNCLADYYHPGTVNGSKYTCCSASKQEKGCLETFFKTNRGRPYPNASPGPPGLASPYSQSPTQIQPIAGSMQYRSAQTYGQQLKQQKLYGGPVGAAGQGRGGYHESVGSAQNGPGKITEEKKEAMSVCMYSMWRTMSSNQ